MNEQEQRRQWAEQLRRDGGRARLPLQGSVHALEASTEEGQDPNLVRRWFRLLSAGPVITPMWSRDFRVREDPLKASVALFGPHPDELGKTRPVPFLSEHSRSMQDLAGQVLQTRWSEASEALPFPGVDGLIEADRLLDPKIARAVERGLIPAVSVEIECDLEQSHPEMDWVEFLLRQGDEIDGRLVCWEASRIRSIGHVAAVDFGADPTALPLRGQLQEGSMDWKKHLIGLLGLAEDASDEDIKGKLDEKMRPAEPSEELKADAECGRRVKKALQKEGETLTADQAVGRLIGLTSDVVPRTEHEALKAQLAKATTEAPLDVALRQRKITPAQKAQLSGWATTDPKGLQAYLDTLAENSAIPGPDLQGGTGSDELRQNDRGQAATIVRELSARLGVKPDEALAELKKIEASQRG